MAFCGMSRCTSTFEVIGMKLDIDMADLKRLILQLSENERAKLQDWLSKDDKARRNALEELLLKAPTISEAQLKRMNRVRDAIDQWR